MGTVTNFGLAPAHDPIYGIRHSNIADRLTRLNWRSKAVCRWSEGRCLYILIRHGERREKGKRERRYFVTIHFGSSDDLKFQQDFRSLKEALAYANGEDSSSFGRETTPAEISTLPEEQGPDTFITGFVRRGDELVPTFTAKLLNQS